MSELVPIDSNSDAMKYVKSKRQEIAMLDPAAQAQLAPEITEENELNKIRIYYLGGALRSASEAVKEINESSQKKDIQIVGLKKQLGSNFSQSKLDEFLVKEVKLAPSGKEIPDIMKQFLLSEIKKPLPILKK